MATGLSACLLEEPTVANFLLGRAATRCSALKGDPCQGQLDLKDSTENGKLGTPEPGA